MRYFFAGILVFTITLSIACNSQTDTIVVLNQPGYEEVNGISLDTLSKWKLYAESSDEGLWEGESNHYILLNRVITLGGEEDLTPPFYTALNLYAKGDTILLADKATQELVCMNPEGEVFWKAGEQGEGPGHFHGIGSIASGSNWIAVANTGLNRIDFFTHSGEFITTESIDNPEDLIALSDTTFVVLSGDHQTGILHIFHADSGLTRSFGQIEPDSSMTMGFHFRDNLRGVFIPPDIIAVISRYEHRLYIFNLHTEEPVFAGVRDLPCNPAPPYRNYNEETGHLTTIMFPSISGVFKGPEGMINIVVDEYMSDGSLLHSNRHNNYAPVTVIDRYDLTGAYLDSYCFPDSGIYNARILKDGRFLGAQQGTGKVFLYEQLEGVQYQ